MKKILIVEDNLNIGGIQKSLVNLINAIGKDYEITVLLINKNGPLLSKISEKVSVVSGNWLLSVMGKHKSELKSNPFAYLWKGFLTVLARYASKKTAFRLAGAFQRRMSGYDVAISFSHPSKEHDLRSCSAEFVLEKVRANKKICFVHCDYLAPENRSGYTDNLYNKFDRIACCSNSVRERFISVLPHLKDRVFTARNFYDLEIRNVSELNGHCGFDDSFINVITVARLSAEKGIDRAIEAIYETGRRDIRYYIVGEGPQRVKLEKLIADKELSETVFLLGEKTQPSLYLKKSDYLILPSYHEAAPMVFDEAKILGVKIITTETTSAKELVTDEYGVVCDNSLEGLISVLSSLKKPLSSVSHFEIDNELQKKQWSILVND